MPWVKMLGLIGWILVVGGVAGECVFEGYLSVTDGQIQTFDEILLADAQRNAFSAETGTLELQVKLAQQQIRAAEAEKELESEKLERIKLEASVSPRRLTVDAQKDIGRTCGSMYTYGSRKRIRIGSYGMDGEGSALAVQIGAGLNSARLYTEQDIGGIIVAGGFDTGVRISAPSEDEQFAECLKSALTKIGGLTEVQVNPERHAGGTMMSGVTMSGSVVVGGSGKITPAAPLPPSSPVEIFVGLKPIPTVQIIAAPKR